MKKNKSSKLLNNVSHPTMVLLFLPTHIEEQKEVIKKIIKKCIEKKQDWRKSQSYKNARVKIKHLENELDEHRQKLRNKPPIDDEYHPFYDNDDDDEQYEIEQQKRKEKKNSSLVHVFFNHKWVYYFHSRLNAILLLLGDQRTIVDLFNSESDWMSLESRNESSKHVPHLYDKDLHNLNPWVRQLQESIRRRINSSEPFKHWPDFVSPYKTEVETSQILHELECEASPALDKILAFLSGLTRRNPNSKLKVLGMLSKSHRTVVLKKIESYLSDDIRGSYMEQKKCFVLLQSAIKQTRCPPSNYQIIASIQKFLSYEFSQKGLRVVELGVRRNSSKIPIYLRIKLNKNNLDLKLQLQKFINSQFSLKPKGRKGWSEGRPVDPVDMVIIGPDCHVCSIIEYMSITTSKELQSKITTKRKRKRKKRRK